MPCPGIQLLESQPRRTAKVDAAALGEKPAARWHDGGLPAAPPFIGRLKGTAARIGNRYFGGTLQAQRCFSSQPAVGRSSMLETGSFDLSFRVLFMVIIGGLGSVLGSFLGSAFIVLVPIFLTNAPHAIGIHHREGVVDAV